MNQMEEALYRVGAHIVFKQPREPKPEALPPLNRMKVPVPKWLKKPAMGKRSQRIIGGIPCDPVNKQAAIITSKTPKGCEPQ
jgi:hypothetical protein